MNHDDQSFFQFCDVPIMAKIPFYFAIINNIFVEDH